MTTHWLLPIDPAAHAEHQPADWRTRADANAVWDAIGRSQPIERWCLRSGFRTMRAGDIVWAYLSKRQEVCARGVVEAIEHECRPASDAAPGVERWFVHIDWDADATALLLRNPMPRRVFGQVPMSTCRANAATEAALAGHLKALGATE